MTDEQKTPENQYLQLMQDEEAQQQRRRQAMLGTVSIALDTEPDRYAAQRRVAQYLGYRPEAADVHPEVDQREAKLKRLDAETANAPTLRRNYTRDDFAKLASDDHGTLSKIESGVGAVARYVLGSPWNPNTPGNTLTGDVAAIPFKMSAGAAQTFRAGFETLAPLFDPLAEARILPANPLRGAAKEFDRLGVQAKANADRLSPPSNDIVQGGVSSGVNSLGTSLSAAALTLVSPPAGLAMIVTPAIGAEYVA
jgi:hypothetical protein